MDTIVPRRRGKRIAYALLAACALMAVAWAGWSALPRGLRVPARDVRIVAVENGIFRDDVVLRASAEPLNSVILDAVESGRVEEVLALDGTLVAKGELLFRLSNPQRNLELLAREAEHAQQISNLSNLRVTQEAARTDHQRRIADLQFALAQAEKQHARNVTLAERGFLSSAALEESGDRLAQQRRALADEQARSATEAEVRRTALAQMGNAVDGLQAGLKLVHSAVDALAVRAPVAGRLTDFRLQVGQKVRPDQNIGRIDDPRLFKLAAQIDEYYLGRVAVGRPATVRHDGRTYPARVSAVFPQIREGRFAIELSFTEAQPARLSPGQGLDAQIALGEAARAMLLPNDAFAIDSGAAWVFVLKADGTTAVRRAIRTGRRNDRQIEVLAGLAPGERVIVSSYAAFARAQQLQLTN
ncbi:efflux RND transporter periplasmic adaptor subunit [Massilia horti]|uniref:Efflux RND transporter periplasmic adaptor subunit n=2 Tax=Massilia horti TaxID=2562153 RepID=A0A4Y9T2R4_9BURK|nr:efflux RND transporter periplasmic adaptor subunit [Massilia horti]